MALPLYFESFSWYKTSCPLSPHLFLLVAEVLSRLIYEAKRQIKIKGIRIGGTESISHLLFLDDDIYLYSVLDQCKKADGSVRYYVCIT